MSPPDFKMLTPNGRFTPNKNIYTSNSSYNENQWTTVWSVSSVLLDLFLITTTTNKEDLVGIGSRGVLSRSLSTLSA